MAGSEKSFARDLSEEIARKILTLLGYMNIVRVERGVRRKEPGGR